MKRREFLCTTLATAAACAALRPSPPPGAGGAATTVYAIFDPRYADARAFAAAAAGHGAVPLATGLDPARLWHDCLRRRAEPGRARLIGLTPPSDVAILRSCASEGKLTLLYEGLHDSRGGTPSHVVLRRPEDGRVASGPHHAGHAWAATLARTLCRAEFPPTGRTAAATLRYRLSHDHPGTLASWAIG